MKKNLRFIAFLLLNAVIITNLAAKAKKEPVTRGIEIPKDKTPENSVVIVFLDGVDSRFEFMQIDPAYPHDKLTFDYNYKYTLPMEPGKGYYLCKSMVDSEGNGGLPCMYDKNYYLKPLNVGPVEHENQFLYKGRFAVPSKPGLYFVYLDLAKDGASYDDIVNGWLAIGNTVEIKDFKYYKMGYIRKGIKQKLQTCAAEYAGTEWEALILKELEEWK